MQRQIVATTYILEADRVLLIYHRKLQKWLPPGGHVEENEAPSEAAIREALEETGLEVELLSDENVTIERWNARSLPRPYLCLLEEVPAHGNQAAHQHIDMIFLSKPIGGAASHQREEVDDMRWFTIDQIEALRPDEEIFVETQQTLRHLLAKDFSIKGEVYA